MTRMTNKRLAQIQRMEWGHRAELIQALKAERADRLEQECQPIETAPKNGTHVQLWRPDIQFIGYFARAVNKWAHNAPGLPLVDPPPTHWMPLPEPPETPESGND